jgi:hypothetical protein
LGDIESPEAFGPIAEEQDNRPREGVALAALARLKGVDACLAQHLDVAGDPRIEPTNRV